jgi:hypothetical protein
MAHAGVLHWGQTLFIRYYSSFQYMSQGIHVLAGFARGAYIARALAGMLSKVSCSLPLDPDAIEPNARRLAY